VYSGMSVFIKKRDPDISIGVCMLLKKVASF
jgi:hypothetical protein